MQRLTVGTATDAELVAAARREDREAFAVLVARHRPRAFAVARALVGDRDDAEDLVQEAVIRAYLGLDRLRRPAHFGSWLCGIVLNLGRMLVRARRDAVSLDDVVGGRKLPLPLDPVDAGPTPEQAVEARELLELVRDALSLLPPAQREVALMYYLDGLTSQEIAALVGSSTGAVRVRLHRARRELRDQLSDLAPITSASRTRKEMPFMVEVVLEDVVVRLAEADGDEPPRLVNERQRVVLLREKDAGRLLPIWIGAPEGDALALQLASESMPRPMTADLMARLVEATGARIERVAINSLRETVFYAVVTVAVDGTTRELDARPSDALNLAARVGAPIFVDEAVLAENGMPGGELDSELRKLACRHGTEEEDVPGEWRSLSPELVRSLYPAPPPR